MKKIFWIFAACSVLAISGCKDDTPEIIEEVSIDVQNTYDDQAAVKYLDEHYLDTYGNIKTFSDTDTSDDLYPKLSALNPVKLPSGVIYIVREGAQPNPGTPLSNSSVIRLMSRSMSLIATKTDDVVEFASAYTFRNTIDGSGVPEVDPSYYYVKTSVLNRYNSDNNTSVTRSFFEIEGFKEALMHFNAFDKADAENYNLQGVIIVPSRAAFARDSHYLYNGTLALRNRSFIFNFQIYKASERTAAQD